MDALSDDHRFGFTVIVFIGSVFSPYYAWSGRRDPENHVAINLALYGETRGWCMTERGRASLDRAADHLTIGPSRLTWDGTGLELTIEERTAPWPRRVRGTIRIDPEVANPRGFVLDAGGRHRWHPLFPRARVAVRLSEPALSWTGTAYVDTNDGDEPMQRAFRYWDWSRTPLADGRAAVLYDIQPRDGTETLLALVFDRDGTCAPIAPPPRHSLPRGQIWRVARGIRSEAAAPPPKVIQTLEDTPFYTRSVIRQTLLGQEVTAMHESIDLDRLASRWVPLLLPFRMPRALW